MQLSEVDAKVKVIVLHSDAPHTLCKNEDGSLSNRLEIASKSFIESDANETVDCIIILGNPFGFPISTGYCKKMFPRKNAPSLVMELFDSLPTLELLPVEHALFGANIAMIPPNGSVSVEIGNAD